MITGDWDSLRDNSDYPGDSVSVISVSDLVR